MKPYDDLHLLPYIAAETVVNTPYDGSELSSEARCSATIQKLETARQALTPEERETFVKWADQRCRGAYHANVKWFRDCLRGNQGRDQLYVWMRHWLAAFLDNRKVAGR